MDLFLYVPRDTWLHRLDPRTKVLCTGGCFLVALLFSHPWYLMPPTLLALGLFFQTGTGINLRKTWPIILFPCVYSLLLWPLFTHGQSPWFTIGRLTITYEAASFGLGMALRLALMVLSGLLLLSTTSVEEFTLALERLGLPPSMSFALSLAFRWVPGLIASARQIIEAQQARGLDLAGGGLLARLKRYPPLFVPLIGHTLRQTRLLAMALESKGFGPGLPRHSLYELRLSRADLVALACMGAIVGGAIWLWWTGAGSVSVRF